MQGTSVNMKTTSDRKGTSSYRGPELVREYATFNNKVDIWAMGCILYELICLKKAFSSDEAVLAAAWHKEQKHLPSEAEIDDMSRSKSSELIQEMLRFEPRERPSAKDIYSRLERFFSGDLPSLPSVVPEVRPKTFQSPGSCL